MIISDDRQTRLAHVIIDAIWDDDLVDYLGQCLCVDADAARAAGGLCGGCEQD